MPLKIGIIDTGINENYLHGIKGVYIFENSRGEIVTQRNNMNDLFGHGTLCYRIIKETCPNTEFFITKIFDKELFVQEKILIKAIELCIEERVKIINISLGVQIEKISKELDNLLKLAYRRNIIVISSGHINNEICFPACHHCVIGVGLFWSDSRMKILYSSKTDIQFFLNSNYFGSKIAEGTSFACAKLSGIAAKIILKKDNITVSQFIKELIKYSNVEF